MKKKILAIAIVFIVLITAIILISRASQPPVPVYKGKTAEQWLDDVLNGDRSGGVMALTEMGTNALPAFIGALEKSDSPWNKMNRFIYPHLPISIRKYWRRPIAKNDEAQIWVDMRMSYYPKSLSFGAPQLKPYRADVLRILENPHLQPHQQILMLVTAGIGSNDIDCVPALVHELNSSNHNYVAWAALALKNIGPRAKAAVPKLTSLLHDPDINTRVLAASTLWKIDANKNVTQSVLKDVFNSATNYAWRDMIPFQLNEIDPEDDSTIPILVSVVQRTNNMPISHVALLKLLGKYGSRASNAVPILEQQIEHGTPETRTQALLTLKIIDAKAAAKYDNPVTGQSN